MSFIIFLKILFRNFNLFIYRNSVLVLKLDYLITQDRKRQKILTISVILIVLVILTLFTKTIG